MNWLPIIISFPVPVLGFLLLARVMRKTEESMAFLSLRSRATRVALQLLMAGFAVLILPLIDEYIGLGGLVVPVVGVSTTVLFTAALVILNAVVRGPESYLSDYIPGEKR